MNMKKILGTLFVLLGFFEIANGQAKQCSDFNTTITASTRKMLTDTNEHQSGNHAFGIAQVSSCTYTHGSNTPNCNTQCDVKAFGATFVNPLGGALILESGTLSAVGDHKVSGGWQDGSSTASNSGTSCSATIAGGAANCFSVSGTCLVNVTVNAGAVSFSTNGHQVWNSGPTSIPNTCPTEPDPQATPTPTPPPPPPAPTPTPCANPDGTPELRFGHTDGESGNPCASPIIIDTRGNGYHLTSAANGVLFDIAGTGAPIRLGWTQPGSGNAFLVLPRADGSVTNGQQLFGNFTPQPPSATPNGYAALAVYDQADHGGNSDGVIDQNDQIFSSLRLWLDENHDGVCQPEELYTLPQLGVFSIGLGYSLSERTDDFGNLFRYKARINQSRKDDSVGRKAYDIFFVTQ